MGRRGAFIISRTIAKMLNIDKLIKRRLLLWRGAKCNLCGYPIITVNKTVFGKRCIKCRSSFIHRAMGLVINNFNFNEKICVYELSTRGALFNFLKYKYANISCSEYYDDVNPGQYKNGIQCQDVQQLTYEDNIYDLITCTEVFEHVCDDIKGFRECYRVLKTGGYFIFSVPLANMPLTIDRGLMNLPPEYHSDRIRGERKVFVYRNYGLDIKQKLEAVGFSVDIKNIESKKHAIPNQKIIVCKKEA